MFLFTLDIPLYLLIFFLPFCALSFSIPSLALTSRPFKRACFFNTSTALRRNQAFAYVNTSPQALRYTLGSPVVHDSKIETNLSHGVSSARPGYGECERNLALCLPTYEDDVVKHFDRSKEVGPVLEVSNLTVWTESRVLFDKVSFRVNRGECVGIVGNNGNGKTSLLNALYQKLSGVDSPELTTYASMDAKLLARNKTCSDTVQLETYRLLYYMRLRGHSLKELALMQFDEITKSDDYSRFLLSENIFTPDKPFNSYVAYMPQNYVSQLDDSTLVEKVISDTNRIYHTRLSIIQDIENHLDYLNEISDGRNVSEASIPQGENDAFDRPSIDWAKRILTIYNDDNQLVRETSRGLENVTTHLIDMFGMRETLPLKVGELSGGFKMRLCLLTQLIHSPQLLFLDEPTNNLDLASVTFLSKILKRLIGTNGLSVLLVSHSPSFLNSICTSIFQVPGDGTLSHHVGDFDNFVQKGSHSLQSRTSRLQHMEANLKKLQQEYKMKVESTKGSQRQRKVLLSQKRQLIEETEEMVNNMKDASKSAYSDVYEKCVLLNDSPTTTPKLLHHPLIKRGTFVFPDRPAFALRDVKLRNEAGEVLVSNLSLNIYNGDRVVILGNNGVGKSTLLTLLNAMAHASKMGIEDVNSVLKPRSYFHVSGGECQGGRNSDVNYFSQNCSDVLKSRLTVEMLAMKFGGLDMSNTQQLTDYLSTFHLHDFMNTNVCDLSFGERSRFILALQFLRDSAFLLLDEPSNHLDIYMQKTLHSLLNNVYTGGGIIVATHDLQLLQNLERVTTVLYIHEFDRLYTFNGDFRNEYIRLKHDTPDLSHEEIGAFLENCRTRYEPRICAPTVDPTSTPQTEEMTRRRLKRLKSFSGSSCKPGKPRIKNAKRYT